MRVLIVGGGIAGLTLAAKLRQQGREPVVIEKAPVYRDIGYGLGLYPLGNCVLHGLGVYEQLLERGVVPEQYEIVDQRGRVMTSVPMTEFTAEAGPMIMVPRTDLVDLLQQACRDVAIRMDTSIESLEQTDEVVAATLSDGSSEEFDLVVGCDGIDSRVRELVFHDSAEYDTGWSLRTWWAEPCPVPIELAREYWGAGRMFGVYPVGDRAMCAAGGPTEQMGESDEPAADVRDRLRRHLEPWCEPDPDIAQVVGSGDDYFLWPMKDVRTARWCEGRVALCGDSATAFLPTAGVGASCALRAASALADELSRSDASRVPFAIEQYERRARKVIEGNQTDSRRLARYMFAKNRVYTKARDLIMRMYPARWAMREIINSAREIF